MCQIKSENPHKSEEDIVCYKVLVKYGQVYDCILGKNRYLYSAPYRGKYYEFGVTYVDDVEPFVKCNFDGGLTLGAGYFHLIEKKEDAFLFKTHMDSLYSDRFVVARCTIPAGTDISRGRYNIVDEVIVDSICARSFVIEEEITE